MSATSPAAGSTVLGEFFEEDGRIAHEELRGAVDMLQEHAPRSPKAARQELQKLVRTQVVTLDLALKEAADGLLPTTAVDPVTLPEASLRLRYAAQHERSLFQSLRLLETLQRRQDKEPALGEDADGESVFRVSPSDVRPFCVAAAVPAAPKGNQPGAAETAAATQKRPETQPAGARGSDDPTAAPNEANFDASLCDELTLDANLPFPAFLEQVRDRLRGGLALAVIEDAPPDGPGEVA